MRRDFYKHRGFLFEQVLQIIFVYIQKYVLALLTSLKNSHIRILFLVRSLNNLNQKILFLLSIPLKFLHFPTKFYFQMSKEKIDVKSRGNVKTFFLFIIFLKSSQLIHKLYKYTHINVNKKLTKQGIKNLQSGNHYDCIYTVKLNDEFFAVILMEMLLMHNKFTPETIYKKIFIIQTTHFYPSSREITFISTVIYFFLAKFHFKFFHHHNLKLKVCTRKSHKELLESDRLNHSIFIWVKIDYT